MEAFLDRIERSLAQREAQTRAPAKRDHGGSDQRRFVLTILSLAAGVPLTGIALGTSGLVALIVVWIGIVLVNVASRGPAARRLTGTRRLVRHPHDERRPGEQPRPHQLGASQQECRGAATPQSDSVATSGDTTVTRPR